MYLRKVYFYIPEALWPESFFARPSFEWPGFSLGIYAWTLQTYFFLKQADFPCEIVSRLPDEGIVVLHRNAFRFHQKNRIRLLPNRFLVCLQGDLPEYPDAQIHIVQNRSQHSPKNYRYFVPHWPQPALRKRDPERGDRFERVSYFGHAENLASELTSEIWVKALQEAGLEWQPMSSQNSWDKYQNAWFWNDYTNSDAVIAVRSFEPKILKQTRFYKYKPATKLYNAWLADVPAILGPEAAYKAERQSSLDYIEVSSLTETIEALHKLKEDIALRRSIVRNGIERSEAFTTQSITRNWLTLFQDILFPKYREWCQRKVWHQQFIRQKSRLNYFLRKSTKTL